MPFGSTPGPSKLSGKPSNGISSAAGRRPVSSEPRPQVRSSSWRVVGGARPGKRTGGSLSSIARRPSPTNGLEPFNRISLPGSIACCVRGCAAVQEIADWLHKLGMSEYAQLFAENRIDFSVLPDLTDQDLEKMGVVLGDRRKILRAIAALGESGKAAQKNTALAGAMSGTRPHDTAERRQVTVVFSDLVGSTALSARMDPEDLREVIAVYQKAVTETVQGFDGFVAKYMGDGVLVYFGYPQAHEDDAERAVRAGLELVEAVAALKASAPLQTRVGIATGLVVVGDLVGSGEAQERGIVGETPNLAARLQGIAEPNTLLIAESTRKLVGNLFELQDLGAQELKGIAGPVRTYAALRASSVESRFAALRTETTPLVGRSEEIDLLLRRREQAKRGDGSVVLISGEPGIGKSRVAETMQQRLSAEPHIRLRFFCSPHHQDSALFPIIAQLERAAGLRREDTAEQRLDKLEALLAQATNDVHEVAPFFADLISIRADSRYAPIDLTPQKRKERTLAALVAQVEGLAGRLPLLMVYEDIHWSDPTTREWLDLLIERVAALRVLAIMTFRPEFSPPWVGRPHVTLLTLNRLPTRQRAEMIEHVTGGKALPKEILQQIVERTDGVPLFIEELTKSVVESGLVTESGDRYAAAGPVTSLAIPTSLHASLLARLDRLAPTREVAQIGAALGRSFSHELIGAVAQVPPQKLDQALEQLVAAELIFRRGTPPNAEYTFKHALVQDAAYSTLLRSRREQIHARIASTLEKKFPEVLASQPQLLAHHCTEAGLAEKAMGYWLRAGQQAIARSAMSEAVALLQRGLAVLDGLPHDPSHEERELELQAALVPALIAIKGYSAPEVGATVVRARSLAEKLDRSEYLVGLLYGEWIFRVVRAELTPALSYAKNLEQLGRTRNDLGSELLGRHWAQGTTLHLLGDFTAARALLEHAEGLQDTAHRAAYAVITANDPYASTLIYLAMTLTFLGYIDQGRQRMQEAVSEARRLRSPHSLAEVLALAGIVERSCGSARTARRCAEEVVALSSEHGFPSWLGTGTSLLGWSVAALGDPSQGLDLISKGISLRRTHGAVVGTAIQLASQAEVNAAVGRPVEALARMNEAIRVTDTTDDRSNEAEVFRLRGDLLNRNGDQSAAEESYGRALAVARRQSAKTLELRAAASLAQLWHDQGKRTEACDLLASVYGWFTEGLDTPVLQDAKKLLDQLGSGEPVRAG
jgi:class 3 adenylate cyclase/tetratricopeptide (TPR) repeat protein